MIQPLLVRLVGETDWILSRVGHASEALFSLVCHRARVEFSYVTVSTFDLHCREQYQVTKLCHI